MIGFPPRHLLLLSGLASAVAIGCGDALGPGDDGLTEGELLILALQSDAPAPPVTSFWLANGRSTARTVVHPDVFNTRFLELSFAAGCVEAVAGDPVGPADSVSVTVRPRAGGYGFTLTPAALTLTTGCVAQATLFFGRYADLDVAQGSNTYADAAAYAAALAAWREGEDGRWRRATGSGSGGTGSLTGTVTGPGAYVVAAPR